LEHPVVAGSTVDPVASAVGSHRDFIASAACLDQVGAPTWRDQIVGMAAEDPVAAAAAFEDRPGGARDERVVTGAADREHRGAGISAGVDQV
jgi:hypothetical protein